ncbi:SHOCT domain-containing protein [Risungbinella massiliensis]|uniref:SHOCT domain-containing protein n=1 Tax=Risungbinella massiliensis TaxID=1329796 RepID=UPI0005CC30D6|nr:SHOCT domain-containing protein [Risungbinella massiliensis]
MIAKGINATIELTDDKVIIHRKGIMAWINGLRGSKEIYLSSITAVQLKKASKVSDGYIEFVFSGGKEQKGSTIVKVAKHENSVIFRPWKQKEFEELKTAIDQRLANINRVSSAAPIMGEIEALEKLAKLRDQGILTEEEFNQKKKQILGA